VMLVVKCNEDRKLLTNTEDTKGVKFYIGNYVTKKQGKSYNISILLRKVIAYHKA
ncbi:hypothetical protein C8Q75DRAFT_728551, partial [Abortiporus biennis]